MYFCRKHIQIDMPVDRHVLLRYRVLDRCFKNAHREYDINDLTDEVNKALEKEDCQPVSERTIREDIRKLQESPYNIELEEGFSSGKRKLYRYCDTSFSLSMYILSDEEKEMLRTTIKMLSDYEDIPQYQWMKTFLVQIESGIGMDGSKRYVEFQHNSGLTGGEHFEMLLGAIVNRQPLKILYRPYAKPSSVLVVYPYYLKQYNDRWFLLAKTEGYDKLSVLPIDRIIKVEQHHVDFVDSEVDLSHYFENVVGVTVFDDSQVEEVKLRISAKRYPYVETKPLHQSQKELVAEATEESHVIQLKVCLNNELESSILALGDDVEVLAPESLRMKMKEKVKNLIKKYCIEENLQG